MQASCAFEEYPGRSLVSRGAQHKVDSVAIGCPVQVQRGHPSASPTHMRSMLRDVLSLTCREQLLLVATK